MVESGVVMGGPRGDSPIANLDAEQLRIHTQEGPPMDNELAHLLEKVLEDLGLPYETLRPGTWLVQAETPCLLSIDDPTAPNLLSVTAYAMLDVPLSDEAHMMIAHGNTSILFGRLLLTDLDEGRATVACKDNTVFLELFDTDVVAAVRLTRQMLSFLPSQCDSLVQNIGAKLGGVPVRSLDQIRRRLSV